MSTVKQHSHKIPQAKNREQKTTSGSIKTKFKEEKQSKVDDNQKTPQKHKKTSLGIKIFYIVAISVVVILWVVILTVLIPVTEEYDEEEEIGYQTQYIKDDSMELGDTKVERAGVKGKRRHHYKVTSKGLLAKSNPEKEKISSEEVESPVAEIIRQGTRKWQYMICSDGHYRYYTDEQFADPNVGFTHKSEDYCAANGHGSMTGLVDTLPTQNQQNDNSTYNYNTYNYRLPSYSYPSYSYTPSYASPPDSTAKYESSDLEQWTPSGSTGTTVESGTPSKWCGFVGNEYVCR